MTYDTDDYLKQVQMDDAIAKMVRTYGMERDADLMLDIELANSGLACANEARERAYATCLRTAVEAQVNPPPPVDDIPPPPLNAAYIVAGREVGTHKPCWFLAKDCNAGVVCCGTNGTGKTVFLAGLLACIDPAVFILAPDKKREILRIGTTLNLRMWYGPPNRLPFNLMSCPTSDPNTFYAGLLESFAPVLGTAVQTWPGGARFLAMLRKSLPSGDAMFSFNECTHAIRDAARTTGMDKYITLADSFAVVGQALGAAGNLRQPPDIFSRYSLMGIDFSQTSLQVRRVIESALTYHLMQRQLARGFKQNDVDIGVVQDEGLDSQSKAQDMVSGSGRINFMTDTVNSQGRAFNLMRIYLFQSMSQAAENAMWNNRVFVSMRLPDRGEAVKAVRRHNLTDDYVPIMMNLPDGEAFISAPGLGRARHMKTDFIDLGGYPSEGDVRALMANEWTWLEQHSEFADVAEDTGELGACVSEIVKRRSQPSLAEVRPSVPDVPAAKLLSDWAQFLMAIRENPAAPSSSYARILKWGGYRTARVARDLAAAGMITTAPAANAKGRPSIRYQLTPKGVESLEGLSSNDNK